MKCRARRVTPEQQAVLWRAEMWRQVVKFATQAELLVMGRELRARIEKEAADALDAAPSSLPAVERHAAQQ